jgi:asparagine synthase (glutamine-hydrolysing)
VFAPALGEWAPACVQAWATCYRGILHNLSGGLDSSIGLSCLTSAPNVPPLTCLHYFASGPNEDERPYARLMARHAGVELVECHADPAAIHLPDLLSVRWSARPWFYQYELEHGSTEEELADQKGANGLLAMEIQMSAAAMLALIGDGEHTVSSRRTGRVSLKSAC